MPFAACPSCNQQNFSRAGGDRTLKCVRCAQVFWVKEPKALPGAKIAAPRTTTSMPDQDSAAA